METIELKNNIMVFYVKASTFPAGVMAAYKKLQAMLPNPVGRNFYGISHGDKDGGIIYMAAVEESYPGEAEKMGCKTFLIKKGNYVSETLTDWKKDETSIGRTFKKLLADRRVDPNGYCLEIYTNDQDVKCMVKLNS